MLRARVVVCLDVRAGRVVKGTQFADLRDLGDPIECAVRYEEQGADEVVFLDIAATAEARSAMWDVVRATAERLFIPLTVGGGIESVAAMNAALRAGADKVAINSAGVKRPALLTECAEQFGSQCVVASVDAKHRAGRWEVFTHGGGLATGLDAVDWAQECAARGAGELLLTSIDRDGTRGGYDLALTRAVCEVVSIPVVASGGAGGATDVVRVLLAGASAALVAGILHQELTTVDAIKQAMRQEDIPTRRVA